MVPLGTRNLLYTQVNDSFFLLGISKGCCSTAITMDNVRHNHISSIDHASVSL